MCAEAFAAAGSTDERAVALSSSTKVEDETFGVPRRGAARAAPDKRGTTVRENARRRRE